MPDTSLHNLSREELLTLVHSQQLEIEALHRQLSQRQLVLDEAGSIAQAALQLNGVFQASQQAADQYLESVEAMKARQESEYALRLAQTEAQCRAMIARAQESAQFYWDALNTRIEELMAAQALPHTEDAEPTEETAEDRFGPDD